MSRRAPTVFFAPFCALLLGLWLTPAADAYVDLAPTLSRVVGDAKRISLVQVDKFSREKSAVILKEVRAIKGTLSTAPLRQELAPSPGGAIPRHVLEWAEPGAQGVMFFSDTSSLICVGQGWYQVFPKSEGWSVIGADRPDLPLAFYGSVARLAGALELMLAGKDAVITTIPHGEDDQAASFDVALNRPNLPGLVKVHRMRATLNMPGNVMAVSANPAYVIGMDAVAEEDLPALLARLKSPEAIERAGAADDLRSLGNRAVSAAPALAELLADPAPLVRSAAAAALLSIHPDQSKALELLAHDLESIDIATRRDAARAAGLIGPAGGSLVARLAALLKDADQGVRVVALESIATLGPVAASAVEAVAPLLQDAAMQIDAADALGRIGTAARPALKSIAPMLASNQPTVQWAAVRAMAQIGGPDAHPAVDFMIKELPRASIVNGYNMMIYLALLGPIARDAVPAIQSARIMQPALKPATLWVIQPEKGFPWQGGGGPGGGGVGGGFGRGGGPGGGGPGGGGGDVVRFIYESYVHELRDRLAPASQLLAKKLVEGTAGDVPDWGYKLLPLGGESTVAILLPHIADKDSKMRERAAVGLGYMGATAASAKPQVEAAVAIAPNPHEKRLLQWCLREVSKSL